MTHERREAIEKCLLMMQFSHECGATIEYRILRDRLKELTELEKKELWNKKELH